MDGSVAYKNLTESIMRSQNESDEDILFSMTLKYCMGSCGKKITNKDVYMCRICRVAWCKQCADDELMCVADDSKKGASLSSSSYSSSGYFCSYCMLFVVHMDDYDKGNIKTTQKTRRINLK